MYFITLLAISQSIYYSCSSCLSINYWLWLNWCRYAGFYAKFIWHVINIKIPRTASELGILLIILNYFSNAFVSISLSFKNFSTFFCCLPFTLSLYFEFNLSISFVSFYLTFVILKLIDLNIHWFPWYIFLLIQCPFYILLVIHFSNIIFKVLVIFFRHMLQFI